MAKPKMTRKQKEILAEMEKFAQSLGLKISYGDLKFAGLRLKPGLCRFRGEKWLVMDRRLSFEDQMEIYREAIEKFDLIGQDIPHLLQAILAPLIPPVNLTAGDSQ